MKGWMSQPRRCAAFAAALAVVVLLAFPRYFGIDTASGGRLHAAMGHHPRWAPPSAAEVCAALANRQRGPGLGTTVECPPSAERARRLAARVNTVRLVIELAGLMLILSASAWLATRWQSRRRARPAVEK
jgi:hypothetical protein